MIAPMDKRVCLLTGASGRLGTAFCQRFADRYHIVAVYHQRPPQVPSQLQWHVDPLNPADDLDRPPPQQHLVYAVQADLRQAEELERVVEVTLARYEQVDVLVHAAVHSIWGNLLSDERVAASVEEQLLMNVTQPLRLSLLLARRFWRDRAAENLRRNRNIVHVSSTAGLQIYPEQGQSIYSASKAALNYLTIHMAHEFKTIGLRVNATAPNSFPNIISTETAAEGVVRLDEGLMTGKILVQDRDGERLI